MFGKALKAEGLDDVMREEIINGEAELRKKYAVKNYFVQKKGIASIRQKLDS